VGVMWLGGWWSFSAEGRRKGTWEEFEYRDDMGSDLKNWRK